MQVFSGWYFVVGNVHLHKLLILKIIEELRATVDHLQNNLIPSHMKIFVNSQFTSASLVKFFIGFCTEVYYHLAQSVCAFKMPFWGGGGYFFCTCVKLESNVCISAI